MSGGGTSALAPGQVVVAARYRVARVNLVMYAGASGDFNPIHWNERQAKAAGLPDVIAHGLYTMAQAGRAVTDWLGDPGLLESYSVRFTRPVVVPDDDDGVEVAVEVTLAELLPEGRARLEIAATCGADSVLGQATAVVRLA